MANTPENFNPNVSIEIKKSLKRTMIQLQKSIDIINQQKIKDLPSLTIVDDLVESSNALVDYLQLKNANIPEINNLQEVNNFAENNISFAEIEDFKESPSSKKVKKVKAPKINLFLAIFLIISISINLFLGFLKPQNVPNLAINIPEAKQDIVETNQAIEITNSIDTEEEVKDIGSIEDIIVNEKPIDEFIPEENQSLETQTNIEKTEDIKEDIISETEIKLPLTPEEYLLTNIKEQIDLITNKYGKKLIVKITANLNQNNLIIYISDDWYGLSEGEQNNLVNDIIDKVKSLDFYKFNLLDIKGNLLARNAVVGKEFIIIKRSIN
ncbi:hypothetical protein [Geminocystis herdmanii]|uniref:hypothetical protein n=1 Tax=Geminocystis herdmanii TaxID=669359 RepID=UPI000346FA1F|nr:hypothetical protein [Geminocystis herdmanii]